MKLGQQKPIIEQGDVLHVAIRTNFPLNAYMAPFCGIMFPICHCSKMVVMEKRKPRRMVKITITYTRQSPDGCTNPCHIPCQSYDYYKTTTLSKRFGTRERFGQKEQKGHHHYDQGGEKDHSGGMNVIKIINKNMKMIRMIGRI